MQLVAQSLGPLHLLLLRAPPPPSPPEAAAAINMAASIVILPRPLRCPRALCPFAHGTTISPRQYGDPLRPPCRLQRSHQPHRRSRLDSTMRSTWHARSHQDMHCRISLTRRIDISDAPPRMQRHPPPLLLPPPFRRIPLAALLPLAVAAPSVAAAPTISLACCAPVTRSAIASPPSRWRNRSAKTPSNTRSRWRPRTPPCSRSRSRRSGGVGGLTPATRANAGYVSTPSSSALW